MKRPLNFLYVGVPGARLLLERGVSCFCLELVALRILDLPGQLFGGLFWVHVNFGFWGALVEILFLGVC